MFATHYFELTTLEEELPACANVHLDATEHNGKLIFMHRVKEGPASQSYGLQVAALAGVPDSVIRRARKYLASLEAESVKRGATAVPVQEFDLPVPDMDENNELRTELEILDPDTMSPREALDALYSLKKLV